MPWYEYVCKQCGDIFQAEQHISDSPLTTCTNCQGPVERLISRCSFVLKGDGWYASGYSKDTKTNKKGLDGEKKTSDSSPDNTKKDTSAPSTAPSNATGSPGNNSSVNTSTTTTA